MNDQAGAVISQGFMPWIIYVPTPFLDQPLSEEAHVLLMRLESLSRNHPWCFPGNDYLVRVLRKKTRAIHAILNELESKNWILRVYRDRAKRHRAGIVMLRRIDPLMPVATDDTIDRITFSVLDGRKLPSKRRVRRGWQKTATEEPVSLTQDSITRTRDLLAFPESASEDYEETEHGNQSPKAKECVESAVDRWQDEEDARNLSAVTRGVRALVVGNQPRSVLAGSITALARLVASLLFDDHSVAFHAGMLWEVVDKKIDPVDYIDAFTETLAQITEIDNFGAYFGAAVRGKQHRITDEDLLDEIRSERGEPL